MLAGKSAKVGMGTKVAAPSKSAKTEAPAPKPPAAEVEAAKDADMLGHLYGKKVKVVRLLAGAGAYQKVGTVKLHNKESDKLILLRDEGHSSGYVTTEGKFCQEFASCHAMKARTRLTFNQKEKIEFLLRYPAWDIESAEEQLKLNGSDLSATQMQMTWDLIQRDVDCSRVVLPSVAHLQQLCSLCTDGNAEKLAKELQKIVAQWQQPGVEKLLLPVWSSKGAAHYTLLVLEAPGDGGLEVACRYYDSLSKEHAGCREIAELMRFIVKLAVQSQAKDSLRWKLPRAVPPRKMPKFQEPGSNRCGLHVLYYAEMETRETQKEIGSLPFPDWDALRLMYIERLSKLRTLLIKFKDLPEQQKSIAKKVEEELKDKENHLQEVAAAAGSTTVLLEKLKNIQESYIEETEKMKPVKYGCAKCEWEGSTCCDPDKRESKLKAQAQFAGYSWPLSPEDREKLEKYKPDPSQKKSKEAPYELKVYNAILKVKKQEVMEAQRKIALADFKTQMDAWSVNMEIGHKIITKAKEAQKKTEAAKAKAKASEVKEDK
jgi:hypothetical protein